MSRTSTAPYASIVEYLEACFTRHGDTAQGVGWPNASDAATRCRVMLDVVRPATARDSSLLDFGCGTSHLYDYMLRNGVPLRYAGLEISPVFLATARSKHPSVTYYEGDILTDDLDLPQFDYIILNGVLTMKCELSYDAMFAYAERLLERVFMFVKVGMAFNVMSTHVDWQRDDLFHAPADRLGRFIVDRLSRHFVMRHDYGLYEYTTYVYRTRTS